jgi:hypothetical protein
MINYNNMLDFPVWMFLQWYYMPHYVIGKQDEWKQWANVSLNGWRVSNLCKP